MYSTTPRRISSTQETCRRWPGRRRLLSRFLSASAGGRWSNAWQVLDLSSQKMLQLRRLQGHRFAETRENEISAFWRRARGCLRTIAELDPSAGNMTPDFKDMRRIPLSFLEAASFGIAALAKQWAERAVKERPAQWRRWIKKAALGPGGPAHKWLSKLAYFRPDPLDATGFPRDPARRIQALP